MEPTHWLLRCLEQEGIKATFAILGQVAMWYPDLVRQIAREGHEIACHGMYHRDLTLISSKQFSEELMQARRILEELSGKRVSGFRAPNFVITGWLPQVLMDQGFTYDSSICPARNPAKFKEHSGAPLRPYRVSMSSLTRPGDANLVEIPVSVFPLLRLPGGSSISTRILGWTWTRITLDNALHSGAACYYMHPYELNPPPRIAKMKLNERIFLRRTGNYMRVIFRRFLGRYKEKIVTAEYYASTCFQTATMVTRSELSVAKQEVR